MQKMSHSNSPVDSESQRIIGGPIWLGDRGANRFKKFVDTIADVHISENYAIFNLSWKIQNRK